MWSTRDLVSESVVSVTAVPNGQPINFTGDIIPFSDVGNVQTIHRVRLTGLTPATSYSYIVGDGAGAMSQAYDFRTAPADGDDWSPVLAIYGDMGISSNAQATMPLLLADAAAGAIDVVVHIGDAAYDLDSANGATGDSFMVQARVREGRAGVWSCVSLLCHWQLIMVAGPQLPFLLLSHRRSSPLLRTCPT